MRRSLVGNVVELFDRFEILDRGVEIVGEWIGGWCGRRRNGGDGWGLLSASRTQRERKDGECAQEHE